MAKESRRSRLVLGTAGLGVAYGFDAEGRAVRPPDDESAAELLCAAVAAGIGIFDTAPAYGMAEERLGRFLATGAVWTKVSTNEDPEASLQRSLQRLRRPAVDLLQWHNWTASMASDASFRSQWQRLRGNGQARAFGATTYGVSDALAAVESGLFEVVQVEWNLLNQRVLQSIADPARAAGVHIAVRSVLLQGVLTPKALPLHLANLEMPRRRAAEVAANCGLTLEALALQAALDHPAIKHVLVGIDTLDQLTAALAAADAPALPSSDVWPRIAQLHVDGDTTDPRTWRTT